MSTFRQGPTGGSRSISDADLPGGAAHYRKFLYDFSVLGGAVSALTLTNASNGTALTLPDKAVICNVVVEAITTATSGGSATVKLGFTGNDDAFVHATAYNHGEFTAGAISVVDQELPLKISGGAVSVLATVATAALTAGKFIVHVEYREGL